MSEEKVVEESVRERSEEEEMEDKGWMKWKKFLPNMTLRVLLAEADDSTRQIITALLRKCSYRGVVMFIFNLHFNSLFNFLVKLKWKILWLCSFLFCVKFVVFGSLDYNSGDFLLFSLLGYD